MKKIALISALLISSVASAHDNFNNFNPYFFNNGFNNSFWNDVNRQFRDFDYQMRQMQESQKSFGTQSRNYFDEESNNYILEIKVKGLDKDNFDVETEDGIIKVKGKRIFENRRGNDTYKSSSSFSHSTSLPEDADVDNVDAKFENDTLTITIPKLAEPKPKSKKVEIK